MEAVKLVHVSCVVLSALFFFGRGIAMISTPEFVGRLWVRRTAESIDTLLLLSGVGLFWITGQFPWQEPWLAAKLTALLLYILLGMLAFHWSKERPVKIGTWAVAIAIYLYMVAVALTRNPLPF